MVKITKTIAQKMLGEVPQDKQFWCRDGRTLKSLPELEAALKQMSEETFLYHANETKNDFSNWVRDVMGDETLSIELRQSSTPIQAARIVSNRISWLKSRK